MKTFFKNKNTNKENSNSKYLLSSICTAGMLLALILILNYAFDLFKVFGGYSMQVFLVFFALGIYLIKSRIVALMFFIATPPLLLIFGFYAINPIQMFMEYFLSFWTFGIFFIVRIINNNLEPKVKNFKLVEVVNLAIFFALALVLKFCIHLWAGYLYWTPGNIYGSLVVNALGVLANGALVFPIFCFVAPSILLVWRKTNIIDENKY